jgi:DNA phosphorothioation-dependent restriction protein DptG
VEPVLSLTELIGRYLSQIDGNDPVPFTAEELVSTLKQDADLEIDLGSEALFEQVVRYMFFDQNGKFRPINLRMLMQTPCTESKECKLADYLVDVLGDATTLKQYIDDATDRLDSQSNALESFATSKLKYTPYNREAGTEYQRITNSVLKKFESDFEYILGARNRTRDYLISLVEFYYFTYTAQAILQLNRFLDGDRSTCVPLFFRLEWEKTSQNRRCYSEGWNILQSAAKKIFAHAVTLEILNQTVEQCEPVDYIKLQELINSAPGEDHRIAEEIKVLTDRYRAAISDCTEMKELQRRESPDGETAAEVHFLFESVPPSTLCSIPCRTHM